MVKNIYPMIDHIDIISVEEHPLYVGYIMSIKIYLNDPSINEDNMYELNFDPHYLAEYYIKKYSKYFGLDLVNVTFANVSIVSFSTLADTLLESMSMLALRRRVRC